MKTGLITKINKMSHCIDAILINKKELRNDKINQTLGQSTSDIKWTELSHNILATTYIPNIKEFSKGKTLAIISTDYFGGIGEQEAKVLHNGEVILNQNTEFDFKLKPINSALKLLNVTCDKDKDEFDTIGLSNFRSNSDFD